VDGRSSNGHLYTSFCFFEFARGELESGYRKGDERVGAFTNILVILKRQRENSCDGDLIIRFISSGPEKVEVLTKGCA